MIPQEHRKLAIPKTADLTLAASIAAVYVATTFVPLTPFIGGPGFITLEIVMLPVIAALLKPPLAAATAFIGSLGMALGQPSFYQVFGLVGLLVPLVTAVCGSIAFHYSRGPIVPWAYVLVGAIFYLVFSQNGTLFWLVPYGLVIVTLPWTLRVRGRARIGLVCLYTAMAEQVTLNILSISVLGLVGPIWAVITPFMYSERALATIGSTALIVALKSGLGRRIDLGDPLLVEVNR
jgi:hypothetical protein